MSDTLRSAMIEQAKESVYDDVTNRVFQQQPEAVQPTKTVLVSAELMNAHPDEVIGLNSGPLPKNLEAVCNVDNPLLQVEELPADMRVIFALIWNAKYFEHIGLQNGSFLKHFFKSVVAVPLEDAIAEWRALVKDPNAEPGVWEHNAERVLWGEFQSGPSPLLSRNPETGYWEWAGGMIYTNPDHPIQDIKKHFASQSTEGLQ